MADAETQAITTGVDRFGNPGGTEGFSNVNMTPPGTFSAPRTMDPGAGGGGDMNALVNQLFQWLQSAGGGGMGGAGGLGGGMMPVTPDALGMGGGADPLGLGGMLAGGGIGLNPAQAAGLRLTRRNAMNVLNQKMANQHRSIGRAGGTDYSRHVQNIDDEIMALQENKIQNNIKNALAYDQMLMNYAQQNSAQNSALSRALAQGGADIFKLFGESPGTFSGAENPQGS